ncbi:putative transcriptional regulator [Erwinia amylovora Ea644]|nr:putative transcriptional regulator [Erwinia amylovora Ea644]CCP08991.1 putative transcriptional regulator [Erwinia amylovora MR1]
MCRRSRFSQDESVLTSTGMYISHIEPLPETLPAGSLVMIPGVSDFSLWFKPRKHRRHAAG